MSAYLYEDALIAKLRAILGDDRVVITDVNNIQNVIARIADDTVKLPLVTLSRTEWRIESAEFNHSAAFEGGLVDKKPHPDILQVQETRLQFLPMRVSWAIHVWTKTREENDEIVRELFWFFITSPTLQVTVPYSVDISQDFNIFVESDVEDNSDISNHINTGEYYRQTINIYTDDAKLWKSSSRGLTFVDGKVIIPELCREEN